MFVLAVNKRVILKCDDRFSVVISSALALRLWDGLLKERILLIPSRRPAGIDFGFLLQASRVDSYRDTC